MSMKKLECGCLGFMHGKVFFCVKACDSEAKVGCVSYKTMSPIEATEKEVKEASDYIKHIRKVMLAAESMVRKQRKLNDLFKEMNNG